MLGTLAVGTFMTMFGTGRFADLKYLRVPAAVLVISLLAALLLSGLEFAGLDGLTGYFLLAGWASAAALGHLVKRRIDRPSEPA